MNFIKKILFGISQRFKNFRIYLKEHRWAKVALIIAIIVVAFGVVQAVATSQQNAKKQAKINEEAAAAIKQDSKVKLGTYDTEQLELRKKYGRPKKGFAWDADGNPVGRGDMKMTPEDVAYAYMQAASKLDFQQVEKYTSHSSLTKYMNRYYSGKDSEFTSADDFRSGVFQDALKSVQNLGVMGSVKYASNKTIITFKVKSIDLSYKDFWRVDKDKIFSDLYNTKSKENDRTKNNLYLYKYIMNYYDDGKPAMTTSRVALTLEKTQASGWLVTNDTALSALAQFPDNDPNNGPLGLIQSEFETYYDDKENTWNQNSGNSDGTTTAQDAETAAQPSASDLEAENEANGGKTTTTFDGNTGYSGDSTYKANPWK